MNKFLSVLLQIFAWIITIALFPIMLLNVGVVTVVSFLHEKADDLNRG